MTKHATFTNTYFTFEHSDPKVQVISCVNPLTDEIKERNSIIVYHITAYGLIFLYGLLTLNRKLEFHFRVRFDFEQ